MRKITNQEDTIRAISNFIRQGKASLSQIKEYLNILPEEVFVEAIKKDPLEYLYIPKRLRNETLSILALELGFDELNEVPRKYRTHKVCSLAVQANPKNIAYVPKEFKTFTLYFDLVRHHQETLHLIPEDMRTVSLCEEAMMYCSANFKHIPENLINEDMCINALRDEETREEMLKIIPLDFLGGFRFIQAHRAFENKQYEQRYI